LWLLQDAPDKDEQLIPLALKVAANPVWAVIMLGGGHFAAGIFQGLPQISVGSEHTSITAHPFLVLKLF
jgi:hypothetical protein